MVTIFLKSRGTLSSESVERRLTEMDSFSTVFNVDFPLTIPQTQEELQQEAKKTRSEQNARYYRSIKGQKARFRAEHKKTVKNLCISLSCKFAHNPHQGSLRVCIICSNAFHLECFGRKSNSNDIKHYCRDCKKQKQLSSVCIKLL